MKLNLFKIPVAIFYFFLGVIMNIIFYYIFSPDGGVDLITLLGSSFLTLETGTVGIIWIGIMTLSVIFTLLFPVWVLFDED